jgi:uncharacterized repeat protein (TIGR01451 family)
MTPQDPLKRRSRPWPALVALLCLNLVFAGAGLLAPSATMAQGELPADQQAILDQVRSMLARPDDLVVQRQADGAYFTDVGGQLQAVLLAATGADGQVVTRCVETLEEAAAFLAEAPTLAAAASFEPEGGAAAVREAVESDPALHAAALAASQTVISILVNDAPGEGFNDATPAAPVGGNPGTTVGQQRLEAFKYAAGIWAAFLQSTVPIQIEAQFNPLFCDAGSAVLGSAGPENLFRDMPGSGGYFLGAERANTWYVPALANKVSGIDLDPSAADLTATFNSNLGAANCLAGSGWYYGFDGAEGDDIDLLVVLLHEFGHGLGFLSSVSLGSTTLGTNYMGRDDIWNYYVMGPPSGAGPADTLWKDMSAGQRAATITSNNLVWSGANVTAAAARLYGASAPQLTVASPGGVGPFTGGAAGFGPLFGDTAVSGDLVAALDLDEDGAGGSYSGLDACNPLSNAAAVSGKIALVSRGACAYSAQVRNLQAAGATAAVIADNVTVSAPPELTGEDSGVAIPAMSLTKAAGDVLRARLADGPVSVSVALARANVSGIDSRGRVKLYAPGSVRPGSSVSHFDVAAAGPNLLMEPAINGDLSQGLDLTDELMRDIGWYPDLNYNGLDDRRELNLGVSQSVLGSSPVFASSFVQPGASFTTTVTVRNQGFTTAGVIFSDVIPDGFGGAGWTAAYTGGAAGPASGAGAINAPLTLPPGSTATFTIVATAPPAGVVGSNIASITTLEGEELVDTSGTADDSAAVSVRVVEGELELLFLPLIRR